MLSRVAETIYWMARYMERSNGMLQVMRTNYILSQDEASEFSWKPLLSTYTSLKPAEILEFEKHSLLVFDYLVFNKANPLSVLSNITNSRENARSIQDHIAKEVWQCLNDFHHFIRDPQLESQMKFGDPISTFDLLLRHSFLYTGTVDVTMSRGEGIHYLYIGKFLERAIQTIDIVRIKLGEVNYQLQHEEEAPELRYLLYSLYGFELYIKTYKGNFQPGFVLEYLLTSPEFPHSILYCLQQMHKYFQRLQNESLPQNYEEIEFLIGKTMNNVKYNSIQEGSGEEVNKFLLELRLELYQVAQSFNKNYFGNS
jgi:uncharacterized alpha-E superfamily protein